MTYVIGNGEWNLISTDRKFWEESLVLGLENFEGKVSPLASTSKQWPCLSRPRYQSRKFRGKSLGLDLGLEKFEGKVSPLVSVSRLWPFWSRPRSRKTCPRRPLVSGHPSQKYLFSFFKKLQPLSISYLSEVFTGIRKNNSYTMCSWHNSWTY